MLALALRTLSWLALMSTRIEAKSFSRPLMRACGGDTMGRLILGRTAAGLTGAQNGSLWRR